MYCEVFCGGLLLSHHILILKEGNSNLEQRLSGGEKISEAPKC